MSTEEILNVPVEELIPCVVQSRERFDEAELLNLAEDIKQNGQLQPGVAWFDAGRGKYVLICGERRWRAIKLAGLPTMAVKVIKGNLTLGAMLTLNLSENLQRSSLSVIERAAAFRRLAQLENITSKQVAERMHMSAGTVSRDLALLDLPEDLQSRIASGELAASIGYELSRIDDPEAQAELAAAITAGNFSRDRVSELVRNRVGSRKATPKAGRLSSRLDGGISVTVSASLPLTREALLKASQHLRKEADKLPAAEAVA